MEFLKLWGKSSLVIATLIVVFVAGMKLGFYLGTHH